MEDALVESFIREAMLEVTKAIDEGNSPFGVVITDSNNKIIAKAHNTQNSDLDPTAHGEINALRMAGKFLGTRKLNGCKAFVNTEPCSMCMSAFIKAYIGEIYFGASQESGNNPDIRAKDVADKCTYPLILKGGYLFEETKEQVRLGREKLEGLSRSFK